MWLRGFQNETENTDSKAEVVERLEKDGDEKIPKSVGSTRLHQDEGSFGKVADSGSCEDSYGRRQSGRNAYI